MATENLNRQQFEQLTLPGMEGMEHDYSQAREQGPMRPQGPVPYSAFARDDQGKRNIPDWARKHDPETQSRAQLPMFLRTQDVIDNVHKIDSDHQPLGRAPFNRQQWSPRQQWELNDPGFNQPLRDIKRWKEADEAVKAGTVKPIAIYQRDPGDPEQWVADGHHRLASFEALNQPLVPVEWRNKQRWGDVGPDYRNRPDVETPKRAKRKKA